MKRRLPTLLGCAVLAGVVFVAACNPPKYIRFSSEFKDFVAQVPWGWSVYLDEQGADYYNYTFVGPFEPAFFRGVPTFSIRWYAHNRYHHLPDGGTELFTSADDYVLRVPRDVYGPDWYFDTPTEKNPKPIHRISVSGWEAQHFVIVSPMEVSAKTQYGVSQAKDGKETVVIRKHAYAVLPMDNGFYVLIYPATEAGYEKHIDRFNHLVNRFRILKDGPVGPKIR